jgi:hypothetical protein
MHEPVAGAASVGGLIMIRSRVLAGGLLFIHSKAIVRDAGTDNAMAFVGSQNPGDNVSLNSARELGILLVRPSIITEMVGIYDRDWEHSAPLSYKDGQLQDPFPPPRTYS